MRYPWKVLAKTPSLMLAVIRSVQHLGLSNKIILLLAGAAACDYSDILSNYTFIPSVLSQVSMQKAMTRLPVQTVGTHCASTTN
jgi:hypothetical protein